MIPNTELRCDQSRCHFLSTLAFPWHETKNAVIVMARPRGTFMTGEDERNSTFRSGIHGHQIKDYRQHFLLLLISKDRLRVDADEEKL
jgi:hypothetical protein